MNCRLTPIDTRESSVLRELVRMNGFVRMLLAQSPGEGPGA